jgi:hypothetical protein
MPIVNFICLAHFLHLCLKESEFIKKTFGNIFASITHAPFAQYTQNLNKENHGLINYIDTRAKCRHRKTNLPVKGHCGRCSSEFTDWRYRSCWNFDPAL